MVGEPGEFALHGSTYSAVGRMNATAAPSGGSVKASGTTAPAAKPIQPLGTVTVTRIAVFGEENGYITQVPGANGQSWRSRPVVVVGKVEVGDVLVPGPTVLAGSSLKPTTG